MSAGGAIDLGGRQVGLARIGYKYTGIMKTFNLGFVSQGINTQVTMKNVAKAWIRCVNSAGGEVGTTLYDMQPIQDFTLQGGFYDLPPLPMDTTKEVPLGDNSEAEKCIYIRQDQPLPLNITALMLAADYGVTV